VLEKPRERLFVADSSFPITPGTSRGDGLDHDQRGDLAAGQHEVADRELTVDQVLADARRLPRSAAEHREAIRRCERVPALVEALAARPTGKRQRPRLDGLDRAKRVPA
jgi:hypothetical protein